MDSQPPSTVTRPPASICFKRFATAAHRLAAANGGITVLVSHRFSTVRMADLILVLDGGRVVQQGSHHDLMQHSDLYAERYTLQARAYREDRRVPTARASCPR